MFLSLPLSSPSLPPPLFTLSPFLSPSPFRYTLIRDGERLEVGTDEIVVGDVLEFKYGNAFPCDGLFIRGNDVSVSEASLTGESNNIKKNSTMNPFLYSGTQVHVHTVNY